VWLDGIRVATVSEYSKASGSRYMLYAATVDPAFPHTIEVRVLGTAGHPRFDVDAFLVLQDFVPAQAPEVPPAVPPEVPPAVPPEVPPTP
jgi:hypothetical protein